jgi:hypothetical protein
MWVCGSCKWSLPTVVCGALGRLGVISEHFVQVGLGLAVVTGAPVPMFTSRGAGGPSRDMHPSRIAPDRPAPSLMHGDEPDG